MASNPSSETEDRQAYLDPITMFRFPFTKSSIQWGVVVGTLLAFHKYNHTSKESYREDDGSDHFWHVFWLSVRGWRVDF